MKLLKWILGLALLVVVLVVAAAVILPMVVDPNDYKDEIVAAVKEQTGRDLVLQDRLELSVFPKLAVRLGGVSLSNAAGFGDDPFAQVKTLDLRVNLMPLLDKRIEVNTVVLDGLVLNLARNAKGTNNWDDLAKPKPEAVTQEKPKARTEAGIAGFSVEGIRITDAQITWDDRQADQRYSLADVTLITDEIAPGRPVSIEAGLKFGSDKPKLDMTLGVGGKVAVSEDFQRVDVSGLVLDLFAIGEGLPEAGAKVRVSSDVMLDQGAKSVAVKNLVADGGVVELSGELTAADYDSNPALKGEFTLKETNLRQLLALLGIAVETADPDVLKRLSGKFGVSSIGKKEQGIAIQPLKLNLDDSKLTGQIRVPKFKGPKIRTKLKLDDIDLDRYLPPKKEGAETAEADAKGDKTPRDKDPLAPLRPLDLKAELEIGKIKVSNARMQDVAVTITAKKGILKMDPMKAKLYDGAFKGKVRLDATERKPKISVEPHLTGIQIGPLLKDVIGQDRLTGKGELHADLKMAGLNDRQIKKTLNGNMQMRFADGALKGINLAGLIRGAQARLTGGAPDSGPQQTDFSEVTASAVIRNGVVDNQDLKAKSPLLRVDGKGKVNLPGETLDYLLTTTFVKSLHGQGGKGGEQLTGVPIPVRFTGSLNSPKPEVDLGAVLGGKAKQQIEEKKKELQESVEKKVDKQIGDKLKGVLGR